jgi:hypothetical protein
MRTDRKKKRGGGLAPSAPHPTPEKFNFSSACIALSRDDTGRLPIHSDATNIVTRNAPTANRVSPGTRIHTSMWISGWPMNSAERAYQ